MEKLVFRVNGTHGDRMNPLGEDMRRTLFALMFVLAIPAMAAAQVTLKLDAKEAANWKVIKKGNVAEKLTVEAVDGKLILEGRGRVQRILRFDINAAPVFKANMSSATAVYNMGVFVSRGKKRHVVLRSDKAAQCEKTLALKEARQGKDTVVIDIILVGGRYELSALAFAPTGQPDGKGAPAAPTGKGAPDQPKTSAPVVDRSVLPAYTRGASGRAYTIYVEQMPGADWDEKIRNAVNRAATGSSGSTIVFPPTEISIKQTIKLWKQMRTKDVDTRCQNVEMRDITQVWASMKGANRAHIPRGITLQGAAGKTVLKWAGGKNQVMLDMPAPWHCTVRNLSFDGNNTEGIIGLRYRAGWEFGVNGGKRNLFEGLNFIRMDVCVDIGGPFCPDLVASTFRRFGVQACRIGFRLTGGNVAEIWFENGMAGGCEEATWKLIGFRGRVVRNLAEKGTPTKERVFRDADGREIFLEQIPKACFKKHVRQNKPHPDVPGSNRRSWVGGGAPTTFISKVVSHSSFAKAWVIDSNRAPVRVEHLRCEGAAGVLRMGGRGMRNVRFDDILIDVNATTAGNSSGYAILYEKQGPLLLMGGVLEGRVGLGNKTECRVMGTRFHNRQRPFSAYLRQGDTLPEGSFFKIVGKKSILPHRRLPGLLAKGGTHKKIGFVQLPGTEGAKIKDAFSGDITPMKPDEK
jgi:hypothetical protein